MESDLKKRGIRMYLVERADKVLGEVRLSGSKNAALPMIVAACLPKDDVILHNVPNLNDVKVLVSILSELGFKIEFLNPSTLRFINSNAKAISSTVSSESNKIRYSLLLLSLLLKKNGEVELPKPGGCNIGDRRYDIHLDSLEKMGAIIDEDDLIIHGKLREGFVGKELLFHTATTSGTENVLIAACIAKGKTVINNAHTRPEIQDFVNFLNRMGAKINYRTRRIEVIGVDELHGCEYTIMNDRDEAVTFMALAGITRGEIVIRDFNTSSIQTDTMLLRNSGMDIFVWGQDTYISAKNRTLGPISLTTGPYPGIADMQTIFAALACKSEGESIITDVRFSKRFAFVNEFKKFGIDIDNFSNTAVIRGTDHIRGSRVIATDLRAGAALMLLGCVAEGKTIVENSYQIGRGYVDIVNKMNALGCKVKQIDG